MPLQTSKTKMKHCTSLQKLAYILSVALPLSFVTSCATVDVPDPRAVHIPPVTPPKDRLKALNEEPNSITRVKLGKDVLVPQPLHEDPLPNETVGPYELRGETLASALQLVLDDYNVSLAFESDKAMTTKITVANLRGKLKDIVAQVCEMADLYCHHENGVITVKDTETFVVDLPPLAASSSSGTVTTSTTGYTDISSGLKSIINTSPTIDTTNRVMIYTATQRAQHTAKAYFDRLRKNTALIIYETHIWEVTLNNDNRTGIKWDALLSGKTNLNISIPGGAPSGTASPVTITPTYTGNKWLTTDAVLDFISEQGAVRTVSQPQLTVLSGSNAKLNVQQAENYVSGITRTPSTVVGTPDTVSTTTATVQTGLTMNVSSAWDQSSVYGTLDITLNELLKIDEFKPDANTTIQLPKTTQRGLSTQIRVRPGDTILIGGLVTERDGFNNSGPGINKPILPTARETDTRNSELVFLLRPRIVVYEPGTEADTPASVAAAEEGFLPSNNKDRKVYDDTIKGGTVPLPAGLAAEYLTPEDIVKKEGVDKNGAPTFLPEQKPELPVPAKDMAPQPAVPVTDINNPPAPKDSANKPAKHSSKKNTAKGGNKP